MGKFLVFLFLLSTQLGAQNLTIQLDSPGKNTQFEACSDIHFAATAQITDGTIRRVDFFANGSRIKSDTREPFEYTWKAVPDGIYEIYAKVVDRDNNEASTEPFFIYVGNVEQGDVIINGEFHCSLSPWRLDNYAGGQSTIELLPDLFLTDDSTGVVIDIQEQGDEFWSIQLMQPFQVKKDHTYSITFTAMADSPKDIAIHVSKNYDDYAPLHIAEYSVYDLEDFGPFEFTAENDDDNLMFKFILGGNTTTIFLDAVQVIDQNWTGVKEAAPVHTDDFTLEQNYPNPFNPATRINYNLDKAQYIKFSIFNILGQAVYSNEKFEQAGSHSFEWRGLDATGLACPSGVYLYQLETEVDRQTRKMHLIR